MSGSRAYSGHHETRTAAGLDDGQRGCHVGRGNPPGLLRLGVVHETTLPYSPYQNGKQEVFWAQLEGRLIEMLHGIEDLKLVFINHAAQAWVEQDYHRNRHREIGATPLQRMLDGPDV